MASKKKVKAAKPARPAKRAAKKPRPYRGRRGVRRYGRALTVKVRVDPKRKKRFAALIRAMRGASRKEASGFDLYWESVGEIMSRELYVAGGYDSAQTFLADEVKVTLRTAQRNVRIAKYSSPNDQHRWGTALLDEALAYVDAKVGKTVEGKLPIAFGDLRFSVVRSGKKRRLTLDDITVRELRAQTLALLRASGADKKRATPGERALVGAMKKHAALSSVSVSVSDGRARFSNVPMDALVEFAEAVVTGAARSRVGKKKR